MISRYDNVKTEIKDGKLYIEVNLNEDEVDVQPSVSGKTMVIATTGGAQRVGDMKLNLTLYRSP
jgi:hypothetical protein